MFMIMLTRNRLNLVTQRSTYSTTQPSFKYQGVKLFNELPYTIRNLSISKFIIVVKKFLIIVCTVSMECGNFEALKLHFVLYKQATTVLPLVFTMSCAILFSDGKSLESLHLNTKGLMLHRLWSIYNE